MPNDQELVVLDPFEVVTGRTLTAGAMEGAPKVANYILGAQHTHAPLFFFMRPDVWITFNSAMPAKMLAAPIRLPTLGDRLARIRVYMRCSVSAGAGVDVTVDSIVEGDSSVTAIAAAGVADVDLGTVDVSPGSDDIDITLEADGSTLSIYGIWGVIEPLASPLPAETVDGVSPIGVDRFVADEMYGAAHNRMLRAATEIGYDRPVMIWCWITAADGLGSMPEHMHMAPFMPLIESEMVVRVHINVDNTGNGDNFAYPLISLDAEGPRPSDEHPITVDEDLVGWVTGTMGVPDVPNDGFGDFPVGWVGLEPGQDEAIDTVASVLSVSMWLEPA